ncbi:hypothetical protein BZG36_01550 [Bifiguratus adelaidae]|uniref:Cytochrome c oxidase assembly protein COX11, mitochondrial n=1 Tax=Bifiguratus adelaidae TaxID=1938954 RepID=A0A261Y3X4_9FUNG|nr:hypothetical protein BZG36_01550 [Bifiguratus adelaidae]
MLSRHLIALPKKVPNAQWIYQPRDSNILLCGAHQSLCSSAGLAAKRNISRYNRIPLPSQACRSMASASAPSGSTKGSNSSSAYYLAAAIVGLIGVTYAAVPLYRIFCARTGYNGTPLTDASKFTRDRLRPKEESRRIKVTFASNTSDSLQWSFKPEMREVRVLPGETALTFYKAKNKSKEDIIGIATYNVTPLKAAPYFNKIQCFCFEEQQLRAGEEVDMPVFFFIDPDFADDPWMKDVNTITLSYTFFDAKYASHLIQPGYHDQQQKGTSGKPIITQGPSLGSLTTEAA